MVPSPSKSRSFHLTYNDTAVELSYEETTEMLQCLGNLEGKEVVWIKDDKLPHPSASISRLFRPIVVDPQSTEESSININLTFSRELLSQISAAIPSDDLHLLNLYKKASETFNQITSQNQSLKAEVSPPLIEEPTPLQKISHQYGEVIFSPSAINQDELDTILNFLLKAYSKEASAKDNHIILPSISALDQKIAPLPSLSALDQKIAPLPSLSALDQKIAPLPSLSEIISSSTQIDDQPQNTLESCVPTIKELYDIASACWREEEQRFIGLELSLNTVKSLLTEYNEAFPLHYRSEDNKHFGFIAKKELNHSSTIFVRADLHGDLRSLLVNLKALIDQGHLDKDLQCAENVHLVFLGDYMDRGSYGLFVLQLLIALNLKNPSQVTLIRGNHEDIEMNRMLCGADIGLKTLLNHKCLEEILSSFYCRLPMACYMCEKTQSENERKEFIMFSHGLIEPYVDPHDLLESKLESAAICIHSERGFPQRWHKIDADPEVDYSLELESTTDSQEKRALKEKLAVLSHYDFFELDDGYDFGSSLYQWGDIAEDGKETILNDPGSRQWKLHPKDIKNIFRLASSKHKVCHLIRGHQHEFTSHVYKRRKNGKEKVLATTLSVGANTPAYKGDDDNQPDIAFLIQTDFKFKDWKKKIFAREHHSSQYTISPEATSLYENDATEYLYNLKLSSLIEEKD